MLGRVPALERLAAGWEQRDGLVPSIARGRGPGAAGRDPARRARRADLIRAPGTDRHRADRRMGSSPIDMTIGFPLRRTP